MPSGPGGFLLFQFLGYAIMSFFFLLSFYLSVFDISGFPCPLLLLLLFVVTGVVVRVPRHQTADPLC